MNFDIRSSEFNPENYKEKRLIWFNGEHQAHFRLFPLVSEDGGTFNLNAIAVGLKSPRSRTRGNQMADATIQIDEDTLRKLEKPKSRFLKPFCDYVLFYNSPQAEAKFRTT